MRLCTRVGSRPRISGASARVGDNGCVQVLDFRGQRCPLPVIGLAKAARSAAPGSTFRVLADDPAARVDIPAWCRMKKQEFLGATEYEGAPAFDVRVS
ncbi:MAG: sulfurtransferase TusA family protein [Corynebacteriales bacterium]|nr:sulfurtransferase TusA family protein [Mycobacteriales bacterium]